MSEIKCGFTFLALFRSLGVGHVCCRRSKRAWAEVVKFHLKSRAKPGAHRLILPNNPKRLDQTSDDGHRSSKFFAPHLRTNTSPAHSPLHHSHDPTKHIPKRKELHLIISDPRTGAIRPTPVPIPSTAANTSTSCSGSVTMVFRHAGESGRGEDGSDGGRERGWER